MNSLLLRRRPLIGLSENNSQAKIRKAIKICVVLMVVIALFSAILPYAAADNGLEYVDRLKWYQAPSFFLLWVLNAPASLLADKLQLVPGTSGLEWSDVLGGVPTFITVVGNSPFQGVWAVASNLYSIIASFGIGLCLIYAVLQIIEATTADRVSPEQFIKIAIKLVVAVTIMGNGMKIIAGILSASNLLLIAIQNSLTMSQVSSNTIFNAVKGMSFGASLVFMLKIVFSFVCPGIAPILLGDALGQIVGLGIVSICGLVLIYGRMFRMGMLISFAPIAFADCFNGMSSGAIRYLKRIASVALQGAVIVVTIILYNALYEGMKQSAGSLPSFSLILGLPITFAAIGMIFGSKKFAEQVFGVA